MSIHELELVVIQAQKLSPKEQLMLIKRLADFLAETELTSATKTQDTGGLIYGKYAGSSKRGATEEDFRLAEWHSI
jgi:hypothetical protein